MDVIKRNLMKLMKSGVLNEYEQLEPMSRFKWNRLAEIAIAQHVSTEVAQGIRNHQYDDIQFVPSNLIRQLEDTEPEVTSNPDTTLLANRLLRRKQTKIREEEELALDSSKETLHVLNLLIDNISHMLNSGISLGKLIELGRYLRTRGDRVDFVKLEDWLKRLHMNRMASLTGSLMMCAFDFKQEELPFVTRYEPAAYKLMERSIRHTEIDAAKDWHFRQTRTGFVRNNSAALRKNLRRSIRYVGYAPLETISNALHGFVRSLSEIEE